MEERALALAARQALLQQTAKQPGTAAVLWLTCAHLAAYNTLPSQVIHRQVALTAHNALLLEIRTEASCSHTSAALNHTQASCSYSCGTSGQTQAISFCFCCISCRAWESGWQTLAVSGSSLLLKLCFHMVDKLSLAHSLQTS